MAAVGELPAYTTTFSQYQPAPKIMQTQNMFYGTFHCSVCSMGLRYPGLDLSSNQVTEAYLCTHLPLSGLAYTENKIDMDV